jgi:hypothetical protein
MVKFTIDGQRLPRQLDLVRELSINSKFNHFDTPIN